MPRKRLPLASPTSIRRLWPARTTAIAASGSSGMPSTRARSLPRPPGMIPSGVSEPAIAPPTAPTRPSPLITTGSSPASTATSACSTPCSRPLVAGHAEDDAAGVERRLDLGQQLQRPAARRGRVDQERQRHPRSMSMPCARSLVGRGRLTGSPRRRPTEKLPSPAASSRDRLEPVPARAASARSRAPRPRGRRRRRCGRRSGSRRGAAPGPPRRRRRGVDQGDEVEEVVGEGQRARAAGLEGDPALGVEPDPGGGARGPRPRRGRRRGRRRAGTRGRGRGRRRPRRTRSPGSAPACRRWRTAAASGVSGGGGHRRDRMRPPGVDHLGFRADGGRRSTGGGSSSRVFARGRGDRRRRSLILARPQRQDGDDDDRGQGRQERLRRRSKRPNRAK